MGIFGWSYPPGCSGPPGDDVDDTICANCGADLPEDPEEGTLAFEGFCSEKCKREYEEHVDGA